MYGIPFYVCILHYLLYFGEYIYIHLYILCFHMY